MMAGKGLFHWSLIAVASLISPGFAEVGMGQGMVGPQQGAVPRQGLP